MRAVLGFILAIAAAAPADTITSFATGSIDGAITNDTDSTTLFADPISASVAVDGSFFTPVVAEAEQALTVLGAKGGVSVAGIFASGSTSIDSVTAINTLRSSAPVAGFYKFDMLLTGAQLMLTDYAGTASVYAESPEAEFTISVGLFSGGMNTTLFESNALLKGGIYGHFLRESGTDLGGTYFTGGDYSFGYDFSALSRTFDLGRLDAGDSITYQMSVSLAGGNYGFGGSAFFGDPNDLIGGGGSGLLALTAADSGGPSNSPVPEPGTWALFGLVAIVGGAIRRRRTRDAT